MAEYRTGRMPGTDLKYQDFEAFLASFALTFACLEKSGRTSDPQDYMILMRILDGFAERYAVQPPLQALRKPRTKGTVIEAQPFTNEEMVHMVNSFGRDFGIGRIYAGRNYDLDAAERKQLGSIVLNLLDRYALADIDYVNEKGEKVPAKIKRWLLEENRYKNLSESVAAWRD